MTPVRVCLALLFALWVALPATADEKAPPPRELASDKALDELVRGIDRHFAEFWARNEITPAPPADDAEFLRRLSLDLVGRIPTAAEARGFIASKDPDKRAKIIDELLARPGHLNFFATVLRQTWVPQTLDNPQIQFAAPQFETWVRNRLRDRVPMDQMVREMLTVPTLFAGRRGQVFDQPGPDSPFLFMQANEFKPENVAAAASRLFLGVKIECAQCHNHPFAPYKKEQFWELAAFFAEVQPTIANLNDPKYKREIKIPDTPKTVQARFFGDDREPVWDPKKSPRETFVDWLTAKDNPFFARNMINRTWAHFLGHGLIDPIDEPSEDNPPVIPELLDELAKAYTDSGYDTRFLIRAVVRSRPYQLTSRQTHSSQADPKRFARMAVKALRAEQLFDSLALATGYHDPTRPEERPFTFGVRSEFLTKFASTEKLTEKQTSILQALTLMNGKFVNDQTSLDRSQYLAGVIDAPFLDTRGKVEALFLASLSRLPTEAEAEKYESYVDRGGSGGDQKKAVADVFWALLNSSEFVLNH
jgi:Protein of unknown function (DUF1549)/Protein of unknown function (DUF1553)